MWLGSLANSTDKPLDLKWVLSVRLDFWEFIYSFIDPQIANKLEYLGGAGFNLVWKSINYQFFRDISAF